MTEQFHLSRLQVINWGVFDGYHSIPFSAGGALIAGASGSGKSSLLDAISLGFLPFNRRNFNASGDNTAAGSSAGRRTVDKYVRGAWGQRSDGGTSQVMYLRGDGTAWSAVAVTYASNTGRTVTGLVLKWLTGESRIDSSSRFVLADGDLDIEDVCNRWAAGRFDAGVFKDDDWRFSTKVESQYLAQLYATIGIRASDAAQQLLGKAKSLKSVGGLEQFVREFMLDEPEQPGPAARGAQADRPAGRGPRAAGRRADASARSSATSRRSSSATPRSPPTSASSTWSTQPMVRAYTDHVRLAQCPAQIDVARRHHRPARATSTRTSPGQLNLAKAEADSLNAQISGSSANIGPLQSQVTAAETAGRAGLPPPRRLRGPARPRRTSRSPTPPTSSGICARNCSRQATELLAKVERNREASTDAEYAQKSARIARDDAAKELKRVEHVGSALPEFALTMRDHICAAVGVDAGRAALHRRADGPAARPEPLARRGGEGAARRGPAAAGARPALGRRCCGSSTRPTCAGGCSCTTSAPSSLGAEPVEPEPNTLAGKLFAVDPTHPCAAEAVDVIAAAGDHVCVDTPDVFPRFRRAVTDTGLYKDSDRLAIKDDRRPLKQSEYLYQGDVAAKINALTARPRRRRGGLPAGPPRRRRHRRRSASSGATGPRRARRSASSSRSGARSTPRPPTGTPTGCASSTSCCSPTTPTSRRSTPAPTNAGRRSRH